MTIDKHRRLSYNIRENKEGIMADQTSKPSEPSVPTLKPNGKSRAKASFTLRKNLGQTGYIEQGKKVSFHNAKMSLKLERLGLYYGLNTFGFAHLNANTNNDLSLNTWEGMCKHGKYKSTLEYPNFKDEKVWDSRKPESGDDIVDEALSTAFVKRNKANEIVYVYKFADSDDASKEAPGSLAQLVKECASELPDTKKTLKEMADEKGKKVAFRRGLSEWDKAVNDIADLLNVKGWKYYVSDYSYVTNVRKTALAVGVLGLAAGVIGGGLSSVFANAQQSAFNAGEKYGGETGYNQGKVDGANGVDVGFSLPANYKISESLLNTNLYKEDSFKKALTNNNEYNVDFDNIDFSINNSGELSVIFNSKIVSENENSEVALAGEGTANTTDNGTVKLIVPITDEMLKALTVDAKGNEYNSIDKYLEIDENKSNYDEKFINQIKNALNSENGYELAVDQPENPVVPDFSINDIEMPTLVNWINDYENEFLSHSLEMNMFEFDSEGMLGLDYSADGSLRIYAGMLDNGGNKVISTLTFSNINEETVKNAKDAKALKAEIDKQLANDAFVGEFYKSVASYGFKGEIVRTFNEENIKFDTQNVFVKQNITKTKNADGRIEKESVDFSYFAVGNDINIARTTFNYVTRFNSSTTYMLGEGGFTMKSALNNDLLKIGFKVEMEKE